MGKQPEITVSPACTHCGEACGSIPLVESGHTFCCAGCVTVYALLRDHNLLDFYQIDPAAGRQQTDTANYAWLDVPKLAERVLRYRDADRCHVAFELPAIHCASCLWLLERLPKIKPGVLSCRVNFGRKMATIVFDPRRVSLRGVAETLSSIGYAPHVRTDKAKESVFPGRGLTYRIGVAGFCFGNIMLLSFPEYFGIGGYSGDGKELVSPSGAVEIITVLRWLLLALSIPVITYAAAPFWRGAYRAVSARRVTIDLPIALGMAALGLRSYYEILTDAGAGYLDSLAGLVFFLLLGRWFQKYTFGRLNYDRDYHDYFPVAAYREDAAGRPQPVASEDVAVGDVLLVRPGHLIPADGRLLTEGSPAVDYSFVTGEAQPQSIGEGSEVFAGGRATDRALRVAVTKTTAHSYLLQLWKDEGNRAKEESVAPPESLIRWFTVGLLLLAGMTFAYWSLYGPDRAYRAATAVLIIACPCALALAAPFGYGTLQRLLAHRGFYLRSAAALRRLGTVNTYVFDKTGTLTAGAEGYEWSFTGAEVPSFTAVIRAMTEESDHPKSRAIYDKLRALAPDRPSVRTAGCRTIPGQGLELTHGGREYRIGSAAFCGLPPGRLTYATVDGEVYGQLRPTRGGIRAGVAEMLGRLDQPSTPWLLSGDSQLADREWAAHFSADRRLFEQTPFDKKSRVEAWEGDGRRVLMVGDGLNDAGALAAATVGLAVNEEEAHFNPACDGIVGAEDLVRLPEIIGSVRRLRTVLWLTYALAFCYNVIGLSYAVRGALSPVVAAILMPLSSVTIVVVATLGAYLVARTGETRPARCPDAG